MKKNQGEEMAKELLEKWKEGKLYWYEVRVKGAGHNGASFEPDEILEELKVLPWID
jgi:hypothetical protein